MSILRADSIRDRAGTGAPDFPNGLTGTLTGNVTGTATTATALSGTPNITVGTVTGTDATFSGNLTVQGTTTTIDTAVTSVDSLAIDGLLTTLGSVGIGTTNADRQLHLFRNDGGVIGIKLENSEGTASIIADSDALHLDADTLSIRSESGTERVRIKSGGTAIFKAGLAEKSNRVTGTLGANPDNSITDGNIIFFNGYNETSGTLTINFTDIHANLGVHECCSFTVIISPNGVGAITTVTIDGQTPADGLKWSGGSAPSAGCLLYTSPSPRDATLSRMPSSA